MQMYRTEKRRVLHFDYIVCRMPPSPGTHTIGRPSVAPMHQRGITSWWVRVRPHAQAHLSLLSTFPSPPPPHAPPL
jgi:hypothetical protein